MLDTQNQGPQCTACGSLMKLTAIEPGGAGRDMRFFTCPALQKGSTAHYRKHRDRGLVEAKVIGDVMYQRDECIAQASICREKAQSPCVG
jgi:hypothetical protein